MSEQKLSLKLLEHVLNLIKLTPFYLLMVLCACFLCCIGKISLPVLIYFVFAAYTISAYFIRYYIHNTFLYFFLHACILPLIIIIGQGNVVVGFSLLYWLILFTYGYIYWTNRETSVALNTPPAIALVGLTVYITAIRYHNASIINTSFMLSILYLIMSYVASFTQQLETYVGANKENDSVSMKQVIRRIIGIVLLVFITLFLLAVVCNTKEIQDFLYRIYLKTVNCIRGLLSHILFDGGNTTRRPLPTETAPIFDKPEHYEPSLLAKILNFILVLFGWTIIIFVPSISLYKLIKLLIACQRKGKIELCKLENTGIEECRSKLKHTKSKENSRKFHRKTPDDKVRYQYYKTIRRYQKYGYKIDPSHTPTERSTDIQTQYNDDIATLSSAYEKARYYNPNLPK